MERTDEQLLLAADAARKPRGRRSCALPAARYAVRAAPARRGSRGRSLSGSFTTLLENVAGIEQPSRLHAWLVTTARRKTWRVITRSKATRPFGGGEDQEDEMLSVADERALPDEALAQLEEQHLVRAALADLDERCRKLLTMLFYSADPPPYSEVAAALGTPEGSIGPTRARCLRKLLDVLRKKGFS